MSANTGDGIEAAAFELRWPGMVGAAWLVWCAVALALSWRPLLWHIDYFQSPGPIFHTLILIVLPLLAAAPLLYQQLRRRGLWRHEPLLLVTLAGASCLFYQPQAALAALWIVVAAYAAGRRLRELLSLDIASPLAEIALSTAAGLGAFCFALSLLGLAGLYYLPLFLLLLVAPFAAYPDAPLRLLDQLRRCDRAWKSNPSLSAPLLAPVVLFAFLFAVITMLVALAPSIAYDAVRWHLPLARYYLEQHAVVVQPEVPYSYFPQSVEALMAAAHALGGQPAAQLVHPIFFTLTLLLSYSVARRCGIAVGPAVLGLVATASLPFLHWTGSVAKNDMALFCFQAAALLCYLQCRGSENFNWLRLGSLFVALSCSVKYTAVFGAVALGLLYLHLLWSRRRLRLVPQLILLCGLIVLPWPLRAYWLTGNPVYPQAVSTAAEAAGPIAGSGQDRPPFRLLFLQYPWRTHFAGRGAFESPSSNPCGMFLVFFAPLWLLVRRRRPQPEERACLLFLALYFLYWGYIWSILRYAILPFMLLMQFTAARLAGFHDLSPRWSRGLLRGALVYCLIFAWLVTMIIEVNGPQLKLFAKQLTPREYLHQALISYGSLEFLRLKTGAHDRVLSFNNCSNAYAPSLDRFTCQHLRPKWLLYDPPRAMSLAHDALQENDYNYLVLPEDASGKVIREGIADQWRLQQLYVDEHFSVHRLERAAAARPATP